MIQIPYDRDGIQELIYGTEGISNDADDKNLGIPWNSGVLVSQVNDVDFHLESACSSFPDVKAFCCHQ
jgi:hypothetical protein